MTLVLILFQQSIYADILIASSHLISLPFLWGQRRANSSHTRTCCRNRRNSKLNVTAIVSSNLAQKKLNFLITIQPYSLCSFEYLYKGDYWPTEPELSLYQETDNKDADEDDGEEDRGVAMQREADLYCLAGYYCLPELQKMTVTKMWSLHPVSLTAFLSISRYVYENNKGQGSYREYFKEFVEFNWDKDGVKDWVLQRIDEGGELAVDLFLVRDKMLDTE